MNDKAITYKILIQKTTRHIYRTVAVSLYILPHFLIIKEIWEWLRLSLQHYQFSIANKRKPKKSFLKSATNILINSLIIYNFNYKLAAAAGVIFSLYQLSTELLYSSHKNKKNYRIYHYKDPILTGCACALGGLFFLSSIKFNHNNYLRILRKQNFINKMSYALTLSIVMAAFYYLYIAYNTEFYPLNCNKVYGQNKINNINDTFNPLINDWDKALINIINNLAMLGAASHLIRTQQFNIFYFYLILFTYTNNIKNLYNITHMGEKTYKGVDKFYQNIGDNITSTIMIGSGFFVGKLASEKLAGAIFKLLL